MTDIRRAQLTVATALLSAMRTIAVIAAALFLATGAVHAETNVRGCFVRVYNNAHLAKHPDQLVTRVKLHVFKPNPGYASRDARFHWFTLKVKVRGKDETLRTGGGCNEEASGLRCWVDCDGGDIKVAPR